MFTRYWLEMSTPYRGLHAQDMLKSHKIPAPTNTWPKSLKGSFMESMITNGKPKLTGLKVLVIDDSKTIRRTAETLLTKEGCEVCTAVDGFDALSKIAAHQPNIELWRVLLPRLYGQQTSSLLNH